MERATTVINFSEACQRLARSRPSTSSEPTWMRDVQICCAYARMVRAEHDAESARIHFEARERGLGGWNEADDLKRRTQVNNLEWDRYIGICAHLAKLPAATRGQAQDKRNTIGKGWLAPDSTLGRDPTPGTLGQNFHDMRAGCVADDHLFPPSMKLTRAAKGERA